MKTGLRDKSTVKEAYGTKFEKPLVIEFEYDEFETLVEMQKEFSENDLIKLANANWKNAARAKATMVEMDKLGLKPKADDPRVIRQNLIRNLVNAGMNQEAATKQVEAMLASIPTAA